MSLNNLVPFVTSKILPLLFSIIGFGLLIVVHELGHFIFCKAFGIHTPTFSIGFGPKIIEKKIGSTNFRISKIPLGGYVEIAGLVEMGQGEQEHALAEGDNSFSSKPYWQKFFVMMGGVLFNLLFAFLAFCTIFSIGETGKKQAITITHIEKGSPAEKAGIQEKDTILHVNGNSLIPDKAKQTSVLDSLKTFLETIQKNPDKLVKIIVLRENKEKVLSVTPKAYTEGNVTIGRIGIIPSIPMPRLPILQAIKKGFEETLRWTANVANSIKALFKKKTLEGVGGPVMILAQGFKFAQGGFISLLLFLAIISVSLAVFNLLPLGVTDGGQLVMTTIEAIIRRPIPEYIRIAVNLVSIALFILLFVYLTYKDSISLFGKTFMGLYKKIAGLFG